MAWAFSFKEYMQPPPLGSFPGELHFRTDNVTARLYIAEWVKVERERVARECRENWRNMQARMEFVKLANWLKMVEDEFRYGK